MYVMTRRLGFLSGEFLAKTQPGVVEFIQALNSIPLPIAPGYAKYPGHTPIWNAAMDMVGKSLGWKTQQYVDKSEKRIADWKGDFEKQMDGGLRVFVEIELGNAASAFRNLAKFDLGMQLNNFDFFLLGVPGPKAKQDIQYATSFDEIEAREELYRKFVHAPCIVFELEPENRLDLIQQTGCDVSELQGRMGPTQATDFIRKYGLYPQWNGQKNLQSAINNG